MDTWAFIEHFREADVRTLALQATKYPEVNREFALDQIAGWQMAKMKLPSYAQIPQLHYPHHLSMEQCSSEQTARYKTRIIAESKDLHSFCDLTSGFGVDFSFVAPLFKEAHYVEKQAYLCELARHNLPLLWKTPPTSAKAEFSFSIHHDDCNEFLQQMQPVDWIFLDPARRDAHGGKVVSIPDCEPNVQTLESLLLQKAKHVMVKLSPMLDISQALRDLRHIQEIHVVAVNNECKELLLLLAQEPTPKEQIRLHSINLQKEEQSFTF